MLSRKHHAVIFVIASSTHPQGRQETAVATDVTQDPFGVIY